MEAPQNKTLDDLTDVNSMTLKKICQALGLDHKEKARFRLKKADVYDSWKEHKKSRINARRIERKKITHPNGKSKKQHLVEVRDLLLTRIVQATNNDWRVKRAIDHYLSKKGQGGKPLDLNYLIQISTLTPYKENNSNYHKVPLHYLSRRTGIPATTISRILKEWDLAPKRKTMERPTTEQKRIIRNGFYHDVSPTVLAEKIGIKGYIVSRRYLKMSISGGAPNNL